MTQKDYSKGKIYVIKNYINDKVYVGSTIDYLSKRMAKHRYVSKIGNCPFYKAMREIGVEHFYIQLVENYPCSSIDELVSREKHYIKELKSHKEGYNLVVPSRSAKEYYQDNKEQIKQKVKVYQEKVKVYPEENEKRKDYQKNYRENNKDYYKNYNKNYYENNKDRLKELRKKQIKDK